MALKEKNIIKLASNENPLGVSPKAKAAIKKQIAELGRYPDGNAFDLKAALGKRYRVPQECIVVGNGSNDLLEMAAAVFLAPGRSAVYSEHCFAVYPLATQARGARSIVVPAKDYGHDLAAMRAAIGGDTRVAFVANPNNPTGTFVPGVELEQFIASVPREIAVVVDEAYTEYLPRELRYDSVAWLKKYANLILTRTFSKVYGLAGLRVGFGLMQPGLADLMNRVRQPFNVNSLALAAATAALSDSKFVTRSVKVNRAGMAVLERSFKRLGLEYIPSCANFITFRIRRAGEVYDKLLRQGVIVRPVAGYGMPEHLRVTIGTPKENARFLKALEAVLDE